MPRLYDEPCSTEGITPRKHTMRRLSSGTLKYPFKAMIVGDYFLIETGDDAQLVGSAARKYGYRYTPRKFTVRPASDGTPYWVCRRIA